MRHIQACAIAAGYRGSGSQRLWLYWRLRLCIRRAAVWAWGLRWHSYPSPRQPALLHLACFRCQPGVRAPDVLLWDVQHRPGFIRVNQHACCRGVWILPDATRGACLFAGGDRVAGCQKYGCQDDFPGCCFWCFDHRHVSPPMLLWLRTSCVRVQVHQLGENI